MEEINEIRYLINEGKDEQEEIVVNKKKRRSNR